MLSRHEHELPPAVARNLHRLTLGLMLKLAELALEFQGARLDHNGDLTSAIDRVRIIRIIWTRVNSLRQPDCQDEFPATPFAGLPWRLSNSSRAIWRPISRARRRTASSNRVVTVGPAASFAAGANSSIGAFSSLAAMLPCF